MGESFGCFPGGVRLGSWPLLGRRSPGSWGRAGCSGGLGRLVSSQLPALMLRMPRQRARSTIMEKGAVGPVATGIIEVVTEFWESASRSALKICVLGRGAQGNGRLTARRLGLGLWSVVGLGVVEGLGDLAWVKVWGQKFVVWAELSKIWQVLVLWPCKNLIEKVLVPVGPVDLKVMLKE